MLQNPISGAVNKHSRHCVADPQQSRDEAAPNPLPIRGVAFEKRRCLQVEASRGRNLCHADDSRGEKEGSAVLPPLTGNSAPQTLGTLPLCHPLRSHSQTVALRRNYPIMTTESTPRKDSMKVEKVSLFILSLCIAVLVYLLVARPF